MWWENAIATLLFFSYTQYVVYLDTSHLFNIYCKFFLLSFHCWSSFSNNSGIICHAFVSPTKYRPVCISCSNIICKSILFFICLFGFSIKILIISFISLKSFTKPGIWFLWQHNIDLRSSSISPLQRNLRKNWMFILSNIFTNFFHKNTLLSIMS